ncbi:hypothetical protein AB0H29_08400 [Streptomyces thermolilacinus]
MDARTWVESTLHSEGHVPLPAGHTRFTDTGFTVGDGPQPGTATLTATAKFTGQDKYEHWGEAQTLAYRLLGVLTAAGAGWEDGPGREPDHVLTIYPPIVSSDVQA